MSILPSFVLTSHAASLRALCSTPSDIEAIFFHLAIPLKSIWKRMICVLEDPKTYRRRHGSPSLRTKYVVYWGRASAYKIRLVRRGGKRVETGPLGTSYLASSAPSLELSWYVQKCFPQGENTILDSRSADKLKTHITYLALTENLTRSRIRYYYSHIPRS
jgi:hypothetical protein